MKKELFVRKYLPAATAAGKYFELNRVVILSQAAIESGWGTSRLALEHHNFFGITGYGKPTVYWSGEKSPLLKDGGPSRLSFRSYGSPEDSFMDFGRLIRNVYPLAAEMSFVPDSYAKEIAYSRYISETNGDNRAAYQMMLEAISQTIEKLLELVSEV